MSARAIVVRVVGDSQFHQQNTAFVARMSPYQGHHFDTHCVFSFGLREVLIDQAPLSTNHDDAARSRMLTDETDLAGALEAAQDIGGDRGGRDTAGAHQFAQRWRVAIVLGFVLDNPVEDALDVVVGFTV
jgi:hypothetical protein